MNNRTALVTGASRGIGKACAQALAGAGYRVILAARSADKLQEIARELQDRGAETFAVEMDLERVESITAGFAKATKEFGRIDILVNNAGITKDGLAVRIKPSDWETVLRTNLSGVAVSRLQSAENQIELAAIQNCFVQCISCSERVGSSQTTV